MKRERPAGRLARFLEIPAEVLVNVPRVEVIGHLQFRVENHQGIIVYEPSRIELKLPDGYLLIEGEELVIGWFDRYEILVNGRVRRMTFSEGRT